MMFMKPGTKCWKKRIDTWAKRMQNMNNGDKIFQGTVTTQRRPTPW